MYYGAQNATIMVRVLILHILVNSATIMVHSAAIMVHSATIMVHSAAIMVHSAAIMVLFITSLKNLERKYSTVKIFCPLWRIIQLKNCFILPGGV